MVACMVFDFLRQSQGRALFSDSSVNSVIYGTKLQGYSSSFSRRQSYLRIIRCLFDIIQLSIAMSNNPNESLEAPAPHSQEAIKQEELKPVEKVEQGEAKVEQQSQQPKNETAAQAPKVEEKEKDQQEEIRKLVFGIQPHITEEELATYIQYQKTQKRPLAKENFEEWQNKQQKKIEKIQKVIEESPVKAQDVKVEQAPPAKTPEQICQEFFKKHNQSQNIQVKPKIITLINTLVHESLPVNSNHITNYLKSQQTEHSFGHFKQWIKIQQAKQIESYVNQYKQSKAYSQLQNVFKKINQIVSNANSQKQNLQINLGIGQNKGKSSIKGGLVLAANKENINLQVSLQVKIKKKLELKTLIEGQLKKWQKQQAFNVFKLCKIDIVQTQKGLKFVIHSPIFQNYICKDIINSINTLYQNEEKPCLKVQGQLRIKNSIRSDETLLQKKRFMKWLCQGFTSHLSIQGNNKVIQHFTSPLSEFFPIFKVVRSGEINLKTKNIASVDKLFEKLGINEISEQTPTLHAFFSEIIKEYLGSQGLPFIAELIKKCLHFAATIPNERISIDINGHLSYLHFNLGLASEACKELGDIIVASSSEMFS